MTHFPDKSIQLISAQPTLVLEAEQDIIYPPKLLTKGFDERFPEATHVSIPNQAHCFMDPIPTKNSGDDPTMSQALVQWLDKVFAGF